MIFVTVGTQKFQFDRLICTVDNCIKLGTIERDVFAQIGNSEYIPQNFEYARYLSTEQYNMYLEKCDIIISHSGVATIVKGIRSGKKVIVVPRLKKYGEHVDDHQKQIADTFEKMNFIVQCVDLDQLPQKIEWAKHHKFNVYQSQREAVVKTIEEYLNNL